MTQRIFSHIRNANSKTHGLCLLGVFLILCGISTDYTWLKNLLDSYATDGHCNPCNPITSFDIILPTIGATVVLFALIYQKEILEKKGPHLFPLICLLFLIFTIYPILTQIRYLDNDEYEHMHKAWLMLTGTIPYLTTKMVHTPLVNWLVVILIKIFGENVSIIKYARLIIYILSVLSLYIIYLITKELFHSRTAAYITLIFVTTNLFWFECSYEIRPDNIMVFFALWSFYFLLKYHKTTYARYLIFFLLTAFLSMLGKQNAAVFYFALLIPYSYNMLFREGKNRFLFCTSILVLVLIVVGAPAIRDFFYVNISRHLVPHEEKFLPIDILKEGFLFNPLFFVIFFIHFISIRNNTYSNVVYRDYVYSIIITTFTFLFLMNRPWMQEMVVMLIFMCIVTAEGFAYLCKKFNFNLRYVAIFLLCTMIGFFSFSKEIFLKSRRQLFEQVEVTQSIGLISNSEEKVFDSYGKAIFRQHPLDPEFTNYNPEKFDRFRDLKDAAFRFVIRDEYYERLPAEVLIWFEDNFLMSEVNESILVRKAVVTEH